MTEEEYFRKHYPDFCYGDKPLSPYWDFFQDGVEFGERQSEKKIEELEEENAELKAKNKWYSEQVCNKECAEVWGNLTKAKEIIKGLLPCCRNYPQENAEKMKQAEQFLKEIKENG